MLIPGLKAEANAPNSLIKAESSSSLSIYLLFITQYLFCHEQVVIVGAPYRALDRQRKTLGHQHNQTLPTW